MAELGQWLIELGPLALYGPSFWMGWKLGPNGDYER
jgi:hypothetical protein